MEEGDFDDEVDYGYAVIIDDDEVDYDDNSDGDSNGYGIFKVASAQAFRPPQNQVEFIEI